MKAVVVEKPGVLAVREISEPSVGEYDCLCRMLYGVTCTGTELQILAGRFPWPVRYPTILGHETVGRVVETGAKVRHLKKGDLVVRAGVTRSLSLQYDVTWGGFTEYGLARDYRAMKEDGRKKEEWEDCRGQLPVPEGIHAPQAAMIPTWRETLSCLLRAGFSQGMNLLILGSGGHGLAFAAHAAIIGAARLAMVGNAARKALALRAGATDFFDYKADKLIPRISVACPVGFDMIMDAVGSKGNLDKFLPLLKPRGIVCIYGWQDYGSCTITPTRARGSFTFAQPAIDEDEVHQRVAQLVLAGKLDARLWINPDEPFHMAEIQKAFEALKTRKLVKALIQLLPQ